jgi:ankyrin repeat protein
LNIAFNFQGADVNVLDRNSITPLIISAYNGDVTILKYLIKNGANLNLKDRMNTSALDCACMRLNIDVIQELIINGSKCSSCTPYTYHSPLKNLIMNKEYVASRMLIESGYDLKNEEWILKEANRNQNDEFFKWLRHYVQNPLSLLSWCRLKIRSTLNLKANAYLEDNVNQLRIPKLLKDYLMLRN